MLGPVCTRGGGKGDETVYRLGRRGAMLIGARVEGRLDVSAGHAHRCREGVGALVELGELDAYEAWGVVL